MNTVPLSAPGLRADLIRLFENLRVSGEDAACVADALILADQWGVASHGVLRVERYVRCITSGGIAPDAGFTVEQSLGAWARVSANGGLGIPACTKATKLAADMAKAHGVGIVNVRMSHHNGAEGVYTDWLARKGMAGVVMSTGNPIMAVTGAVQTTLGNNPFSYAVPAGRYGVLMMDVAMSAVADGKVQLARSKGEKLAPGCILDREGKPSVEPEDYFAGGKLLPFGGHKGYGLAVMVECMAGILSGAALTKDINSWNEVPGRCGNTGHMIMAFDIAQMMGLDAYEARVEKMIGEFKSARRLEGVEEIFFPGELEMRRKAAAGDTVTVIGSTWESLQRAAAMAGAVVRG